MYGDSPLEDGGGQDMQEKKRRRGAVNANLRSHLLGTSLNARPHAERLR